MCPFLFVPRGDNEFVCPPGTIIFTNSWRGQIFYIGDGGFYDHVNEEMDVSKTNILVSEATKLSKEPRIFRGS